MGSFPRRVWPTLGYGIDEQLGTNAFDHALQSAGLCDYDVRAQRIVGAVNYGLEGMLRMINMRGRNPVLREGLVPENIENSEKFAESKYEIDGRELNFYATKGVYYSEKYDFECTFRQ